MPEQVSAAAAGAVPKAAMGTPETKVRPATMKPIIMLRLLLPMSASRPSRASMMLPSMPSRLVMVSPVSLPTTNTFPSAGRIFSVRWVAMACLSESDGRLMCTW